ncbi:MAG: hypothetical protein ACRDTE_08020 [Pseudonocardiaceae bacterium]
MGKDKDRDQDDGKKDEGKRRDEGRHRDEDNTGDGQRNRPIPPPHEPNKHDR